MEDIDDVGDNAFTRGFLNKKYCDVVVDRLNLLRRMKVSTGGTARGTGKFIVSDESIILDLSKFLPSVIVTHPLMLLDYTDSGVAQVRVLLGNTAGRLASAGMTAGTDDPPLLRTLTASGVRYIYAEITVSYDTSTGIWSSTASAIREGASVPANTATLQYFEIGHATRESDGAGGYRVERGSIHQEVSGSQWVARTGNATTYVDANGLI